MNHRLGIEVATELAVAMLVVVEECEEKHYSYFFQSRLSTITDIPEKLCI